MRGAFLALALFCFSACSSTDGGDDGSLPDCGACSEDGTDGEDDTDQVNRTLVLKVGPQVAVDQEEAGLQLDLAAPRDGQSFAIAYYRRTTLPTCNTAGDCREAPPQGSEWECRSGGCVAVCTTPIQGDQYVPVESDEVRYAWQVGENWQSERVTTISSMFLTGIELAFDGAVPITAFLGGASGLQVCGGTDLMVARRTGPGNWSMTTAVATSGQAGTAPDGCPVDQGVCDFGDVVGLWPSMAIAPNGTIGIVYRDIHNGYEEQSQSRSDLEYTWSGPGGGNWEQEPIDLARGSGIYNALAFAPNGNPAVAFVNDTHGQIGFSKRASRWAPTPFCTSQTCTETFQTCDSRGQRCSIVIATIAQSIPEESVSMTVAPDGRYLVVYFDPVRGKLMLAHSDSGLSWQQGIIDSDGFIGMYPTIAINPVTGMPAVAYYRCGEQSGGAACHRNNDGVRFAHFTGIWPDDLTRQTAWKKCDDLKATADRDARDGLHLKMAFLPDGRVGFAYAYLWTDPSTGKTERQLMFRLGTWVEE